MRSRSRAASGRGGGWIVLALWVSGCAGADLVPIAQPAPIPCDGPPRRWSPLDPDDFGAGSERPSLDSELFTLTLDAIEGEDRLAHAGAFGAAWMSDGRHIVSVGRGALLVWDARTGRAERVIEGVPDVGGVGGVAVSPDGRHVAWVQRVRLPEEPRELAMIDLESGARLRLGAVHGGELRFSRDGARLMTGQAVFSVPAGERLWAGVAPSTPVEEPTTCARRLEAGRADVPPCPWATWLPDGRRALELRQEAGGFVLEVSGPLDGVAARVVGRWPAQDLPPRVQLSPERGALAVLVGERVEVFEEAQLGRVGAIQLDGAPDQLALSEDGRRLLVVRSALMRLKPSGERVAEPHPGRPLTALYDVSTGASEWTVTEGERAGLGDPVFSEDGALVVGGAAGDEDATLTLDARTGELLGRSGARLDHTVPHGSLLMVRHTDRFAVHALPGLERVAGDGDRVWLAVEGTNGRALLRGRHGELVLEEHDGSCRILARRLHGEHARFTPDGGQVLAWLDGELPSFATWDASTGAPVSAWRSRGEGTALLWPEARQVLFEPWDTPGTFQRFDLRDGALLGTWAAPILPATDKAALGAAGWDRQILYAVSNPVFGPSGQWMADALGVTVRTWPLGATRRDVQLHEHREVVTQLVPVEAGVLFGGGDGRVWRLEGSVARPMASQLRRPISALARSRGGRWVAAASTSGEVVLLDVESLEVVASVDLGERLDFARWLAFARDDEALMVWTAKGARLRVGLAPR